MLRGRSGWIWALGATVVALAYWVAGERVPRRAEAAGLPAFTMQIPGGGQLSATAVGHEYREDDLPNIAAAPDGSLWVAWLSFVGDRDDVAIRHYKDGKWQNLLWVPGTSGDSWLPQVGVDAANRVWVVWSQQVDGNWDLYARRFDPQKQEWGRLERLTSDPLPDVNPRLTSDGKGHLALVWQGFRGKNSNIFLKTFDGERWSADIRITNRPANDWEPAAAIDSQGAVWIAYDSYKNGNYDVYLARVAGGVPGPEMAVAATPRFEARPTVAVDKQDRVWVAWEVGQPNWGKDQGYIVRDRKTGAPLGGLREIRLRCYEGGRWKEPAKAASELFTGNVYQPHVFSDGRGSVWLVAKRRMGHAAAETLPQAKKGKKAAARAAARGYWEYWAAHLDGDSWSQPFPLPNSKGRSSTRMNGVCAADGSMWMVWDTDNRKEGFYHRPIRQQVYAGQLPSPAIGTLALRDARPEEEIRAPQGHVDEAGDIKALRAYAANVGGKTLHILRGDFHRHTELSWDGGGANDGSLQDFFRYMLDVAAMDFGAATDHQGGQWPYWWYYTQKMTDMYHAKGAFVPIFGYERSASFPNGHRNVFFAKRGESRVTPWHMRDGVPQWGLPRGPQGDESGIGEGQLAENDTKLLYEDIRPRNGIAIPHTSGTRMGTDWRDNDPDLEPVVEIFQGCRTSYEKLGAPHVVQAGKDDAHMAQAGFQPEGMVNNAWAKGYRLGVIASSDHGSTHISYAMVYTDDFSRKGILDAIRKRHTYGATDNILLDVRMGPHFMGDEFRLTAVMPLKIKVRGTRVISRLDVIKDSEVIYSTAPNKRDVDFEYTDKGPVAGRHYYYVRVLQEDQMIAWSSPMFVNYR